MFDWQAFQLISKSYLDSFLEAMAKRIEDPASLL